MTYLLLFFLRLCQVFAWFDRCVTRFLRAPQANRPLSRDYFRGLHYLLEQQPDKAVDIFIKLLEVDSDTVEMHLALGCLFRQRGEIDRAIRLHQNLIARPQLSRALRAQALFALGQDYMQAGLLQRAEQLLLDVAQLKEQQRVPALRLLLSIYQQEKSWQRAIEIAKQLQVAGEADIQINLAHYYCELAEQAYAANDNSQALQQLRQAKRHDSQSARAYLLEGQYNLAEGDYKVALRCYQQIKVCAPDYLSEVVSPLVDCYQKLGKSCGMVLRQYLQQYPQLSIVKALANYLLEEESRDAAIRVVTDYLHEYPSLLGVQYLLQLQGVTGDVLLRQLIQPLTADNEQYHCQQCGFNCSQLYWLCPGCERWSTIKYVE